MSKTILSGFEIGTGKFTKQSTGELVPYNNRVLYFITDSGQSAERVGFFPFKEKLQATALVRMLGLRDVAQVNDVLNTLINKPVRVEYCPGKDNTMVVCGLSPDNSGSNK